MAYLTHDWRDGLVIEGLACPVATVDELEAEASVGTHQALCTACKCQGK